MILITKPPENSPLPKNDGEFENIDIDIDTDTDIDITENLQIEFNNTDKMIRLAVKPCLNTHKINTLKSVNITDLRLRGQEAKRQRFF